MNNKLLDDAQAAGFCVVDEVIYADEWNGIVLDKNKLAKFAALQQSQWISIDKPPPDNKKILLGKYHDDEYGWYWIASGVFEKGKFYLGITDDEFKLTDKPSYQNPTHWSERLSPPTDKDI